MAGVRGIDFQTSGYQANGNAPYSGGSARAVRHEKCSDATAQPDRYKKIECVSRLILR